MESLGGSAAEPAGFDFNSHKFKIPEKVIIDMAIMEKFKKSEAH